LLEAGVAIRCNNLPTLSYKLDRLLSNGARLAQMQANSRKMGRPNAAREIVQRVNELASGVELSVEVDAV
jgi:processive 1,2-diacylglycerol beta-glucosyltransferase